MVPIRHLLQHSMLQLTFIQLLTSMRETPHRVSSHQKHNMQITSNVTKYHSRVCIQAQLCRQRLPIKLAKHTLSIESMKTKSHNTTTSNRLFRQLRWPPSQPTLMVTVQASRHNSRQPLAITHLLYELHPLNMCLTLLANQRETRIHKSSSLICTIQKIWTGLGLAN